MGIWITNKTSQIANDCVWKEQINKGITILSKGKNLKEKKEKYYHKHECKESQQ